MSTENIRAQIPDTKERLPENGYPFERSHDFFSYEFELDGKRGTLGALRGGLDATFPADLGGEVITLLKNNPTDTMTVELLDDDGEVKETHVLDQDGDTVEAAEGVKIHVTVPESVKTVVEYACKYPGQEPKV